MMQLPGLPYLAANQQIPISTCADTTMFAICSTILTSRCTNHIQTSAGSPRSSRRGCGACFGLVCRCAFHRQSTWMHNFGHMAGGVAMLCRSFGHAVTVPMKRRYPQTDCKGIGGKEISWEGDNARLVSDKNPAEVHHRPQAYARRCICMQAQGVARSLNASGCHCEGPSGCHCEGPCASCLIMPGRFHAWMVVS